MKFLKNKTMSVKPEHTERFNLYEKLTKCLIGTNFNVPEYLRLRREIITRIPFYYSLKDNCLSKMFCCLRLCRYSTSERQHMKERSQWFKRARNNLATEFDVLKLLKRIKKFNIVKKVMLRKTHLKMLKYSKLNTINYYSSSDGDKQGFGTLKALGYIRKITEGAANGNEMDQKVLNSLIDKKAYNKLCNNTLDIKAIKNNESVDFYSQKKLSKINQS